MKKLKGIALVILFFAAACSPAAVQNKPVSTKAEPTEVVMSQAAVPTVAYAHRGLGWLTVDMSIIDEQNVAYKVSPKKFYYVAVTNSGIPDGTPVTIVIVWPGKSQSFNLHVGKFLDEFGAENGNLPGQFGVRYFVPEYANCNAAVYYVAGGVWYLTNSGRFGYPDRDGKMTLWSDPLNGKVICN